MQTRHYIFCGLLLAAAAPMCAHASPLGVKPGAWETTLTTTMSGMPKMPEISKEQLAQMPPERRAMVEKMRAASDGKPVSQTVKSCVKDTDTVDKFTADDPRQPNCKKKVVAQTSTSLEVDVTCSAPHASHAHVKMKAVSPSELVSTTEAEGEGGIKVHADSKSRWVASSCAGINGQ